MKHISKRTIAKAAVVLTAIAAPLLFSPLGATIATIKIT